MAGYDMPADDTALLDLLLQKAKTFWSFWSGDHEFLLAALQRKRRVVELKRSIDIRLRNVNLSAKSYKFFSSVCNWNKKLWNGHEKKRSFILMVSWTSQPRYSNVIQTFWAILNENPYKLQRHHYYGSFANNIKINNYIYCIILY